MTEPREPEPVREGESVQPEQTEQIPQDAKPDTGSWHPVAPETDEEPPAEPVESRDTSEPLVEPVESGGTAESLVEPVESGGTAESLVEPVESRGTAEPLVEPVESGGTAEPLVEPVESRGTAEPLGEPVETRDPAERLVEPVETPDTAQPVDEPTVQAVPQERPEDASRRADGELAEPVETPVPEPDNETSETIQLQRGEADAEPTMAADAEATVAQPTPLTVPGEPTPPRTEPTESIFRAPSPSPSPEPEPTRLEPVSEEEQKLAAERAARREARAAALAATAPVPLATPAPVVVHRRTNDRFWGSLGLFLLRIVLAGIFTIRGLNLLTDIPAAEAQFAKTALASYPPGPQLMAIVTGVACLLIALSLLLGLLTRVAGLGIALIAGGALALVYWGPWSPFVPGQPGFLGEYELLLAVVGILLLLIGGGGWSLDRSFRAGRERDKAERAAEAA